MSVSPPSRRRGLVAVFAAGLLVLSACGLSRPGAASVTGSAAADASVASVASPATDPTGASAPGGSGGSAGSLQFLAGALDASRSITTMQGTMTATAGDAGSEKRLFVGTFNGRQVGNRVDAMSVDMTIQAKNDQELDLNLLYVDGVGYIGGDQLLQQLKVDKPWLELSPDSSNQQVAALGKQLDAMLEGVGPEQIEKLQEAAVSATEIGPEDVDGVPTTHYRVVIDVKKSLEALRSAAPSVPASADLPETIPTDLWLDDRGRIIKTQVEQEVQGQRVVTISQVTAYDQPVDITAPDPADVSTG